MTVHQTRTFEDGGSVAVHLPDAFGVAANEKLQIEQVGDTLTIRRMREPKDVGRELRQLIADLEAIGRPSDGIQSRDPFEFPDRPGL